MNTIDPTAWRDGGEIGGWNVTLNPSAGSAWVKKDQVTVYGVTYTNVRQLIGLIGDDEWSLSWSMGTSGWDDRKLTDSAKSKLRADIEENVIPHIPAEWTEYVVEAKRADDRDRLVRYFNEAIQLAVRTGRQLQNLDDGAEYDAYPSRETSAHDPADTELTELAKLAELAELGGAGSPKLTGADGAEGTVTRRAKLANPDDHDRALDYLPANYDIVHYIEGEDVAGWTLDGYVLPRLASGLIFAEEVK